MQWLNLSFYLRFLMAASQEMRRAAAGCRLPAQKISIPPEAEAAADSSARCVGALAESDMSTLTTK